MRKRILTFCAALLAAAGVACTGERAADVVLTNGNIYTNENIYTSDGVPSRAEALAVVDGKIAAVGSSDEMGRWVGPDTRVIDLTGKFVMPGFNDAHVHLWLAGQQLLNVDLEGTTSLAEFQQRIREHLEGREPDEWITGGGWDQSMWKENRMPTRADLDAVSTDYPMSMTRVDGHSVVVNSAALSLAEISRLTPDPAGGEIVRDQIGEPTGWLKDRAVGLVSRLFPETTRERRKEGILLVLEQAARFGVTSMQDDSIRFDSWESYHALRELKDEGRLTARIHVMLPFEYPLEELIRLREEAGTEDPWLRTGLVKTEADGSGGSRSAAMFADFANDPGNPGYMKIEPARIREMVLERDAAGFQIALHAIGDRANRIILDAFAVAREVNRRENARHRIEHVQYLANEDVERFRELGVIASMQPSHLLAEIRWTRTLLGTEREFLAYRVRSLLDAGTALALGTDYPVEGLRPMRGLYAAVAREFEAGGPDGGYQPQERIRIEEAIWAYTMGSAYAEFEEARKGSLTPGKFADLIVLSKDIARVPPQEILQAEVLLTMAGGEIVYEK